MAATASSVVRRDQPTAHYLPGDIPPPAPQVARRRLSAAQRNALKDATPQEETVSKNDVQTPLQEVPTTEELEEEPRTRRAPIALRRGERGTTTIAPHQPQQKAGFPWMLFVGIGIPVAAYSMLFVIIAGWIMITNTLTYGPTHTSYTQAIINGELGVVQTSNVDGTIFVTVLQTQHDGSITARTYSGPVLEASAWNGDLRSIVATARVAADQTITVHLIGSVNYFHLLFARPELTFSLVPDKQAGYKVVQS